MDTPTTPSSSGFQIPQFILDDLCSRFIINIPEEERQDLIRIFFQIELAHWFYLDFYCQESPELRPCGIKDFSAQIFHHCPTLSEHADNVDKILGSWREYKMAVPTYGAILLDPTLSHCLLVQGYWARTSWGFPKGKVNEGEGPDTCAVREVFEETGFDSSHLLDKEEYIEYKMNDQLSRLYIVPGVSMDTTFAPRTRKEIKNWDWFRVDHLPAHKKDLNSKTFFNLPANAFFMVMPFIKPLRKWINRRIGHSDSESEVTHRQRYPHGRLSEGNLDAQRLKPVQLFTGDLAGHGQLVHGRQGKGGKGRSLSTSPSSASKLPQKQQRTASPRKKRDSGSGPRRPAPVPDLLDLSHFGTGKRQSRKDAFCAKAWMNFKLDTDAVLSCL